ncbi:1692_t:CDS:2 [Rhizophagus irregularis]|nr:1692_t:CDS:2 [Rhizophagus irregularis]
MVVDNIDKEEISDKVKYLEDDMRRIVEKAIDDQVKEKELIREELLKFKYTDDDVRKIVVKETDDLIKEQELIKEKLSRFKYTEADLEKRVAKAVNSRDSRINMNGPKILLIMLMVAQKLEERINEQREKDKEIISKFKYTEEDVNELVAKAIEDQIKEKNLFKENVIKTAREIAGDKLRKLLDVNNHVINEMTNKGMKDRSEITGKDNHSREVSVSQEDLEIYNKVNEACSSRLPPEIKKEVVVDEKVGQKRNNKDELNRGMVSSDNTDDDSGSETKDLKINDKKQGIQGGKGKKGGKGGKSKKKSKKGW